MGRKRSAWSRINAWLDFEVPSESLEAYRRASVLVDELHRQVEDRRLACVMDGLDPWSMPPGTRAGFLCAWNATVLQAMGDALLEADAADTPRTAGFVPRPLRDEVATYYAGVEAWLDRAGQAFANPDYRLDCPVPDRLPVPAADPFPVLGLRDSRARGLLAALRAVRDHAAAAMTLLPRTVADPARQAQVRSIRRRYDAALAAARQAEALHANASTRDVEGVLADTRTAIGRFYELGQRIVAPELSESGADPAAPAPAERTVPREERTRNASSKPPKRTEPALGLADIDVWCLTDPAARRSGAADVDTLGRMWRADGARARALQNWLHAELESGSIDVATDQWQRAPHWFRCPWGPVYVARRTVHLDGVPIPVDQRFVLDAGPGNAGRPVRLSCRLVAGDARRLAHPGKAPSRPPRRAEQAPRPDGSPGRLPGEPAFDVWCLTHPAARRQRKATASALKCMWDAAPRRVLEFHDQIQAALERGDIAPAVDGRGGALYGSCRPWGPVYVALRTVYLDGMRIPPNQRFVLETGPYDFLISCRLVARDPNDAARRDRARRRR